MRQTPSLGKASRDFLHKIVYRRLGATRREIIIGPGFGVDNAVVKVGDRKVLVITTDPLSLIPSIGPQKSAWLSVHLLASDLTTSGFPPQYGIFDFNLPPRMKDSEFADYWKAFHVECGKLGIAILGGHTGRFQGCDYTIIGGGVLCTMGPEERYLTSNMAERGDDIILTKGAAIGATAVLTRAFPRTVRKALGPRLFSRAWSYISKMTTVKDALTAITVGVHGEGVTAMHDSTEGGVTAAILELADASRLGVELDLGSVAITEETREICRLFQIDPLVSLSEGSLVIASRPNQTSRILNKLSSARIEARVVGRLTSNARTYFGTGPKRRVRLKYPSVDPYWRAFWKAMNKRWS